jgi:hypothetical protein
MRSEHHRDPARTGNRLIGLLRLSTCAAGAMLVAGLSTAGNLSEAQAQYQQDRAACLSNQSNQDRATCLREAGAALQAARRGDLGSEQAPYDQNRLSRCNALPAADREDCVRRMQGGGTASGSVEGGGIYRELRTIEPAK